MALEMRLCCSKMAALRLANVCFRRSFHASRRFSQEFTLVEVSEVESFVERCMIAVGTPTQQAKELAKVLVAGDKRGHFSHGLNRLEMYVGDIKLGTTICDGKPEIVNETQAVALVNGNSLLGPTVGNFCMDIAMEKAKETGIGWVVATDSNHYGIAGWYTLKAVQQGLIGLCLTNTSPLLVPTRGRKACLGTNPISVAAPGVDGDSFVLDMATSAVALGKIEMNERKQMAIPPGWGVNNKGLETFDPKEVIEGGGQMPLGGTELTSGYKGYGLAMMVEVFCGLLAGSAFGPHIRQWKGDNRPANLGQCFAAINPAMFTTGFEERMQSLMDSCRNMEPAEGETEVLVAGDPERCHLEKVQQDGGIHYHNNLFNSMNELADDLQITRMCKK